MPGRRAVPSTAWTWPGGIVPTTSPPVGPSLRAESRAAAKAATCRADEIAKPKPAGYSKLP